MRFQSPFRAASTWLVVSLLAVASQCRLPSAGPGVDAVKAPKNAGWGRLPRLGLWSSRPIASTDEPPKPAYDQDVVVRFDVPTPEYETVLAAGADSLGLDVWCGVGGLITTAGSRWGDPKEGVAGGRKQ